MAFPDFTSPIKVKELYPELIISKQDFIPTKLEQFELSPSFEKDIQFGIRTYKPSEAFADKFLIVPILNKVWQNYHQLNLWTEAYIKADDQLQGRPDYLISLLDREQYEVLSLPIVALVEAKQENFSAGWGQCLAEMLACQKLNKSKDVIIYGIVATGQYWEFAKLDGDHFIRNSISYNLSNLQQILNVVNYIFKEAEKEIPLLDISVILRGTE